MTTITIRLRDDIARYVEASAEREHKTVSEWVEERIAPLDAAASQPTAGESHHPASGYSQAWLALFGSLANEDSFASPARTVSRPVSDLKLD
jgi:hypothetical protein